MYDSLQTATAPKVLDMYALCYKKFLRDYSTTKHYTRYSDFRGGVQMLAKIMDILHTMGNLKHITESVLFREQIRVSEEQAFIYATLYDYLFDLIHNLSQYNLDKAETAKLLELKEMIEANKSALAYYHSHGKRLKIKGFVK